MVLHFVRIILKGSNLEQIKGTIDNLIDKNDLFGELDSSIFEETLTINIYNKNLAKNYSSNIKTYLQNNKDNLTSIKIIKYDNCSHR